MSPRSVVVPPGAPALSTLGGAGRAGEAWAPGAAGRVTTDLHRAVEAVEAGPTVSGDGTCASAVRAVEPGEGVLGRVDDVHTVGGAVELLERGELSAVELVEACLAAVERSNGELNAFVHVAPDQALDAARVVDDDRAARRPVGPLAGVPFGVKDLEDCAGMPTSWGSRWFLGGPPAERDDLHVARLRAAGAIPLGKTAAPEFGSWAYTASPALGVTRNPWDPTRTPGGSSGGSSAAVSAGMVPFCTGSDGGGSIRTPAGFTGLPGLKPSYGRVPTYGVTHLSQNAVNFALATTVADTTRLLDVCAGPSPYDRTSLPSPPTRYEDVIETLDVSGLRVAWSLDLGFAVVDPEVAALTEAAMADLVAAAGATRVEHPLVVDDYIRTYLGIEAADQWVDLPDGLWPERADELDPGVRPGWEHSAGLGVPAFARSHTRRRRLEHQVASWFEGADVLVTPMTAIPAFPAEGPMPTEIAGTKVHGGMSVIHGMLANLCNLPAMSLPAGTTATELPVGLQVIAGQHREDVCLRLGRLFEQARPWPRLAPVARGGSGPGGSGAGSGPGGSGAGSGPGRSAPAGSGGGRR